MNKREELLKQKAELKIKLLEIEDEISNESPIIQDDINWSEVISICEAIISDVRCGRYHEDDDSENMNFLYHDVMEAVYGEGVFDWIKEESD